MREAATIANLSRKHSISIAMFGFILDKNDPRWKMVDDYASLLGSDPSLPTRTETKIAFSTSIYLGPNPAISDPHPAAVNLSHIPRHNRLQEGDNVPAHYKLLLRTSHDLALKHKDPNGVTACPEALHQHILMERTGQTSQYVARLGTNIHLYEGKPVVSITNIQGAGGAIEQITRFMERVGVSPFNFLVQLVRNLHPNATILGLKNPRQKNASGLYNAVLKSEHVPRISNK